MLTAAQPVVPPSSEPKGGEGRGEREVYVDADLSPIAGTHSENSVYSDFRGLFK